MKTASSANSEPRFAFGKNWQDYSSLIDEGQIGESVHRLNQLVGGEFIQGKSFLDIGCGSGLHSLAALKLGASRVDAFDYDPLSVSTTLSVLSRFWEADNVRVTQGDILADPTRFPKCEVVYSWGVLHHTGNMRLAILNASRLVQPGGILVLALYGKTPYCGIWKRIKRWYCNAGSDSRQAAERWYARLFGWYLLLRGKRLKDHVANYRTKRGMDFHHDVRDWLGGYPYESISSTELCRILEPLAFECIKQNVKRRSGLFGSGCDEYVFRSR